MVQRFQRQYRQLFLRWRRWGGRQRWHAGADGAGAKRSVPARLDVCPERNQYRLAVRHGAHAGQLSERHARGDGVSAVESDPLLHLANWTAAVESVAMA